MKFISYTILAACISEVLGGSGALGAYDKQSSSNVVNTSNSPSASQTLKMVHTSNVEGSSAASSAASSTTPATTTVETTSSTRGDDPVTVITTQNSAGETYTSTVWWTNTVSEWWTPVSELTISPTWSSDSSKSSRSSSTASASSSSSASIKNVTNAAARTDYGTGLRAGAWALAIGAIAL
ncbi:Ncw2p LALA0_S05e09054g [Lachancea lanzarotensis]|uniref:LALA0S05e09054g1_1 n=1 Tax=Lachancea lanzarotensis TaxID=1245769 RepID=A0A0C7N7U2_9SACH|nr:uncharacterized protein LALA0_S05e09054g [Lachancea lanzarotensis]CEP62592.1 LALA0S05e09054g1_1 [Lachancea lanzarotensis]